jgi:hypothetical protein
VTEDVGASLSSGFVQLTVDLSQGATKRDVVKAIEHFADHINKSNWPPA